MYLPPYQLIRRMLDTLDGDREQPRMIAALAVMRHLLQEAVSRAPFDEDGYMASNPDVATAIRRGEVATAHEHYVVNGYFEGREGAGPGFDEAWYVKRYPDVALAVASGQWVSGFQHYRQEGMFEWRSPTRSAEAEVERWRGLLTVGAFDPALAG